MTRIVSTIRSWIHKNKQGPIHVGHGKVFFIKLLTPKKRDLAGSVAMKSDFAIVMNRLVMRFERLNLNFTSEWRINMSFILLTGAAQENIVVNEAIQNQVLGTALRRFFHCQLS